MKEPNGKLGMMIGNNENELSISLRLVYSVVECLFVVMSYLILFFQIFFEILDFPRK